MPQGSHFLPPYIGGRFVSITKPERVFQTANPARPNDILALTGWNKELVGEIVDGMKQAQPRFAAFDFEKRMALVNRIVDSLRANADELRSQMSLELSRPPLAVQEEWALCEKLFNMLPQFCADALAEKSEGNGWTWSYAPVGLVMVSANVALPVYTILSATLPALAAGNAVLVRPSLHCPLSASIIASCFHQADLPPGIVQLVYGDLEVCRRLVLTHQFDTVLYVGGEESSEQIRRDLSNHQQNTRLVLCSGGKNASLILESANVEKAVRDILYGAFVDCGQRLESTGIAFVHEKVSGDFISRFVSAVKSMPIAARKSISDDAHFMSPLCSANSHERYLRFQGIAAREADETLRWGKSIDNPGNGFYVSPGVHLMSSQKVLKSVYAGNALFGPDIAIVPVSSADEALVILDAMNATRALTVHTAFEEEVRYARSHSNVPTVLWNEPTTTLEPQMPITGRGKAGNSNVTGARFLFSTVFPKSMGLIKEGSGVVKVALSFLSALILMWALCSSQAAQAEYRKSVEGSEVVKSKKYPRGGRLQINALQGGGILNQSFIDTTLINLGVTYHFNEWHSVNVEGFFGINKDRNERDCVENFFYNTDRAQGYAKKENKSSSPCAAESQQMSPGDYDPAVNPADEVKPGSLSDVDYEEVKKNKNYGPYRRKPAYVPIRQVNQMFNVNYQWTPVYGKALYFLSFVGYLDFFTNIGLGLTMSNYYPIREETASGLKIGGENGGQGTDKVGEFGIDGRPVAESQTSPTINLGIGNRFFFLKNFLVSVEVRNFTVIGGDAKGGTDIMNFFAVWGGLGVMF
jgi:outer membrane beta-barrel protein